MTVVIATADLLRFNSGSFERTYERYLGFFMVSSSLHSLFLRKQGFVAYSWILVNVEGEWETWVLDRFSALIETMLRPSRIHRYGEWNDLLSRWSFNLSIFLPSRYVSLIALLSSRSRLNYAWSYRHCGPINHHALNLWYLCINLWSFVRSLHSKTSFIRVRFLFSSQLLP